MELVLEGADMILHMRWGDEDNAGVLKHVHLLSECHHAEVVLKILDRQILVLYASLVTCQAATMQPFAPQPFPGSPSYSEQDQGSNAIPPAADHVADDGLQDDHSHDFNHGTTSDQDLDGMIAEFWPWPQDLSQLSWGLNRCFLPDGALPPSYLYHVIDSMSVGAVKWENFKITYKCKCKDGQNMDEQDELIKLAGLGGQDGQDEPDALGC
ncbi:hypothetical protein EDC04DRAFT_2610780 [Pisolithus marmoratus]|nr:hypothetical protein EDC04DRAFT_2610780 [Pisolithus marmoratus]